ncbi:MAG: heat-inducible transcriptional repressor HrcA [Rhodothermales bacterium]|nr:heat-inducible transcriptional repressor HrcA [Rhodothermales bacterium]
MSTSRPPYRPPHRLNEREQEILRLVVRSFIETAGPVGSRYLARHYDLGLSPASIRNTMSDLEEHGYLGQPYTSAGRMPTEQGYRVFVDELMAAPELTPHDKQLLKARLDQAMGDTEVLLKESSRLLGEMSNLLGVVLSPRLTTGVLERLEVVPLSSTRVMVVVSVRGGFVKTIIFEAEVAVDRPVLDRVVALLNERLAGLRLEEIRRSYASRTRDLDDGTGLVRLILDASPVLFSEPTEGRLHYGSAQPLIAQPEFQETERVRRLIEVLEDEGYVVHLLEDLQPGEEATGHAIVRIGSESGEEKVKTYSIVTAPYRAGEAVGTVGILGPTRMDYRHAMALVENTAELLSRLADGRPA